MNDRHAAQLAAEIARVNARLRGEKVRDERREMERAFEEGDALAQRRAESLEREG